MRAFESRPSLRLTIMWRTAVRQRYNWISSKLCQFYFHHTDSLRLTRLSSDCSRRGTRPTLTSRAKHMKLSAGANSVSPISCSLVSDMEPNSKPPSFWKEYTQFLQKPTVVVVWSVGVAFFVNDISNYLSHRSFGVIRVLPYMGVSALVFVITIVWWYFKSKERRQRQKYIIPHSPGTQMTQMSQNSAPHSFIIPVPDDASGRMSLPVESSGEDASNNSGGQVGISRTNQLQEAVNGDPSILSPSETDSRLGTSDHAAQRLRSDAIESKNEAHVPSPASSMVAVENDADIARLMEALRQTLEHQRGRCICLVSIINNNQISELLEIHQPQANLPGSRVLHKRIEIDLQTENWWKDVVAHMRMAKTFDKDSTVQLGSVAVLKYTDAGFRCWMLQEHWTPVILDLSRSPQSLLDLISDERPKWTLRGFSLEKATLRVATTERSQDLTILHRTKTEKGVEEVLFEEPHSFPMFSKKVYISASITKDVEGHTFKLHSEARKVQRAFWISVLDGLIPSFWTGILITTLLLLRGFLVQKQQACWLAIVFPIGIYIYFLVSHRLTRIQATTSSNLAWQSEIEGGHPGPEVSLSDQSENVARDEGDRLLAILGRCLFQDRNLGLQTTVVVALRDFASKSESSKWRILNEGALVHLVRALSRDENPSLQASAAGALWDLALGDREIKLRISNEDGALVGLISSLFRDDNPELQADAAGALQSLAFGEIRLQILEEDRALKGLVRSLSQVHNPRLQANAAAALWRLALGTDEIRLKILEEDGALIGLVRSLSHDNNSRLQANAAGALQSLAVEAEEVKLKILNEDGALVGLIRSLFRDDNPELQVNAAGALQNLALGTQEIRLKILNEDRALAGLVRSLSRDNNSRLQATAAAALWGLAIGTEELKLKILNEDGALTALISSLSRDDNPKLQANAAGTLQMLALGTDEIRLQILEKDAALPGLVRSLFQDNNSRLRSNAAAALCSLATGREEVKVKISNEDGALTGLISSLFQDDIPELQANAAAALWSLAFGTNEIRLKILKEHGALAGLVWSLSHDKNSALQANAAAALRRLANWNGGSLDSSIETENLKINEYGALIGLRRFFVRR